MAQVSKCCQSVTVKTCSFVQSKEGIIGRIAIGVLMLGALVLSYYTGAHLAGRAVMGAIAGVCLFPLFLQAMKMIYDAVKRRCCEKEVREKGQAPVRQSAEKAALTSGAAKPKAAANKTTSNEGGPLIPTPVHVHPHKHPTHSRRAEGQVRSPSQPPSDVDDDTSVHTATTRSSQSSSASGSTSSSREGSRRPSKQPGAGPAGLGGSYVDVGTGAPT